MRARVAVLTMLGILSGGCDELTALQAPPRELVVSTASAADAEIAEKILLARFDQHLPQLVSSARSRRDGQLVTFIFERGSPGDEVLEYLVSTRGRLLVSSPGGPVWVAGKDVTDMVIGGGGNELMFEVTDAAARRLEELSSSRQGQVITVNLDGNALATARVTAQLSRKFSIPVKKDRRELYLIITVVRSGELPEGVAIAQKTP